MSANNLYKHLLAHTNGRQGFFYVDTIVKEVSEVQDLSANISVVSLSADVDIIELTAECSASCR